MQNPREVREMVAEALELRQCEPETGVQAAQVVAGVLWCALFAGVAGILWSAFGAVMAIVT